MSLDKKLQAALDAVAENASGVPLSDWAALERAIRELQEERNEAAERLAKAAPWMGHACDLLVQSAESLFSCNSLEGEFLDPHVEAEYSLHLAVVDVLMETWEGEDAPI